MNNSQRWKKISFQEIYTFLLLRDVDVHMLLNIVHYLFLQNWIRFFQRAHCFFSSKAHLWEHKTPRQIINLTSCRIKESAAQSMNVQELLVFEQSNMSVWTYAGDKSDLVDRSTDKTICNLMKTVTRRPVTHSRLMKMYVSSQDFPSARPCI